MLTETKIVIDNIIPKTSREVYDFQVEGNENLFVDTGDSYLLVHNCILKPLEDAGNTDTIWIIGSMDPAKFTAGNGKAIANRCDQFSLEPPSVETMTAFAKRIVVGEQMKYLMSGKLLAKIAEASNQEMRNVANIVQSLRDYYEGLPKNERPEKFDVDVITKVLKSSESNDDRLIVDVVVGALTGQYKRVHRALLDVADPFMFLKKVGWAANFVLGMQVVDRHPKLWWSPTNKAIMSELKGANIKLGHYAGFAEVIVDCTQQASTFTVGATEILSARIYRFIKDSVAK